MMPSSPPYSARQTLAGLAVLMLVCALAYGPGLGGPFVFDDIGNLVLPLQAWLHGETSWEEIVFGNHSGMLGRPLSMLSFLANAAASGGLATVPFKATNVAIHLLNGAVLYVLLARLLPRDPWLKPEARLIALLIAGAWLLHPMQVSTVLYVVQRMAQLSALFTLGGLLAYVYARQSLELGRHRTGLLVLFLVVPACMVAAVLSKENGALLPALCGVIELGYFRPSGRRSRPLAVRWFFVVSLLLPLVAASAWYGMHPQKLLGAYEGRLFTLDERLLSQPRVLLDYMGALLLPRGPSLGVYTDDFLVSRGLLDPPGTLLSIVALLLLVTLAWRTRLLIPALFTGIGLYLTGHAMESTVFPLEIYFEHRNYLPSAGIFLALTGVAGWGLARLLPKTDAQQRTRRWVRGGCVALLLMLAFATWARAGIWSSPVLLAEQGVRQHPGSVRALMDQARLWQAQGRNDEVQDLLDNMASLDNPTARHVAAISSVAHQCATRGATTPPAVARIGAIAGSKLQLAEMLMLEDLARLLQGKSCRHLERDELASMMVRIADAAPQPPGLTQIWRTRFFAAHLYAGVGDLARARQQLALAWNTGKADPAAGAFLVRVHLSRGEIVDAERVLHEVVPKVARWDRTGHAKLKELGEEIASRKEQHGSR